MTEGKFCSISWLVFLANSSSFMWVSSFLPSKPSNHSVSLYYPWMYYDNWILDQNTIPIHTYESWSVVPLLKYFPDIKFPKFPRWFYVPQHLVFHYAKITTQSSADPGGLVFLLIKSIDKMMAILSWRNVHKMLISSFMMKRTGYFSENDPLLMTLCYYHWSKMIVW